MPRFRTQSLVQDVQETADQCFTPTLMFLSHLKKKKKINKKRGHEIMEEDRPEAALA